MYLERLKRAAVQSLYGGRSRRAKLLFFCGKMAAGKSTLSRELAKQVHAMLLVQDEFLERLFPGEIVDIPGYLKYSSRLKDALGPHICSLLSSGTSVVLDFPGNTRNQRAWFRQLFEASGADHELHLIDASDELCKRPAQRTKQRASRRHRMDNRRRIRRHYRIFLSHLRSKSSSTSSGTIESEIA